MSCEDREVPQEVKKSAPSPVDPNAAYRQLERDFFLRPGFHAPGHVPANWRERAELIGTSVYTLDENGKIIGERFDWAENKENLKLQSEK